MRDDVGFKLSTEGLTPGFSDTIPSNATADNALDALYTELRGVVMESVRSRQQAWLDLGYKGAFFGAYKQ